MRRRFSKGIELTEQQFFAQQWIYSGLTLFNGVLYCKDGPPNGNPKPFGVLYRPVIKGLFGTTLTFSGIELEGKAWCAQVWSCETFDTTVPAGAVKQKDGTIKHG